MIEEKVIEQTPDTPTPEVSTPTPPVNDLAKQLQEANERAAKAEALAQQKSKLEDALEMGLTKDEYNLICKKIDKTPNMTELGIFSAMFSEH